IGAPGQSELGLGAIVDGADPHMILNEEVVRLVRPKPGYLQSEQARQLRELERRRRLYRGERPAPAIEGRTVIVVDDGIATGGARQPGRARPPLPQPRRPRPAGPPAPPRAT